MESLGDASGHIHGLHSNSQHTLARQWDLHIYLCSIECKFNRVFSFVVVLTQTPDTGIFQLRFIVIGFMFAAKINFKLKAEFAYKS